MTGRLHFGRENMFRYMCGEKRSTVSFKQRALLGEVLYEQYLENSELCDVTLIIHGREQKAHWSVLMVSPYFKALYDSGLSERQTGRINLNLEDEASINAILKYLYTGEIWITMENMEALLRTADYLLVANIKHSCESFFASRMGPDLTERNSVKLCLLAAKFDLPNLYGKAYNYILSNFSKIAAGHHHHSLSLDTMEMFVQNPALDHVKPEKMFQYIVSWVEHDLLNRKEYFQDLFCCLSLERFTQDVFERDIEKCPLVLGSPVCQNHISKFNRQSQAGILRFKRNISDTKEVFHFFCAHNECLCSVHSLDVGFVLDDNMWEPVNSFGFLETISEPSMTCLEDDTIIITEKTMLQQFDKKQTQAFHVYSKDNEVATLAWKTTEVPRPSKDFKVEQLVSCGGHVYAVCCPNTKRENKDWKVYQVVLKNPRRRGPRRKFVCRCKIFTTAKDCHLSSLHMQACVLHNRYIFISAGQEDKDIKPKTYFALVDTEKFPHGLLYQAVKDIFCPVIFPVGDQVVITQLTSRIALAFHCQTKEFAECPQFVIQRDLPLSVNRRNFAYRFHYNHLYVFGGFLGVRKLTSCFRYSYAVSQWVRLQELPKTIIGQGLMCLRNIHRSELSRHALQAYRETNPNP
ncbi:kelch repeat and BTB domain-containing protein 2-like [Liolophura sinensis]|uniref:kelch repeat and BTB domain-containing protein 2-like n=1 Tax=Liolophura sinensis TaxID=3198878 RepID=UPI003158750F